MDHATCKKLCHKKVHENMKESKPCWFAKLSKIKFLKMLQYQTLPVRNYANRVGEKQSCINVLARNDLCLLFLLHLV